MPDDILRQETTTDCALRLTSRYREFYNRAQFAFENYLRKRKYASFALDSELYKNSKLFLLLYFRFCTKYCKMSSYTLTLQWCPFYRRQFGMATILERPHTIDIFLRCTNLLYFAAKVVKDSRCKLSIAWVRYSVIFIYPFTARSCTNTSTYWFLCLLTSLIH